MKISKLLTIVLVLSIFASSCGVSVMKTTTSKTLDIHGAGVVQNPVLVDLEVKETKVTGTAEGWNSSLEALKQNAIADAIAKTEADVLVDPKYQTETSNERITVTVTGFPATYKNFRPMKEEDIKLLEAGITQKAVVHESTKVVKTGNNKKKTGVVVFVGILGLVLASLLI